MKAFPGSLCWFAVPSVILLICCYTAAQPAVDAGESSRRAAALRTARKLAEAAVAQSKDLRLNENHVVIESKAAEVLWQLDPQLARTLLRNVLARLDEDDFAEAPLDSSVGQRRLFLRQRVLQTSATYDPQFTLDALNAGKREDAGATQYRRQVELDVASRVAQQEPARALKLAEKNLGDEVPHQYAQIISSLWQKDPPAAANLAQAVISTLGRGTGKSQQNVYSAFSMFSILTQLEESAQATRQDRNAPPRPSLVPSLQALADFVASSALDSRHEQYVFSNLLQGTQQFERYAPAKFASLKEKFAEWKQQNPEAVSNAEFSTVLGNNNLDNQLEVAAKAPPQNRQNFYQQIAWNVLNKGDLERARQIITQNITEPGQRSQIVRDLVRQAAWQALSKGDFDSALIFARESGGATEERAIFLAQLVTSGGDRVSKSAALAVLDEAANLLNSPPRTATELNAALQVAGAFAAFDSQQAAQMLEATGERINDVINALAPVDAFLPYSRSFEEGELLLETGYASGSLIAPYAYAAAALAKQNPEAAASLADKLQRPEARAQIYLEIARTLATSAVTYDGSMVFTGRGHFRVQ